MYSMPEDDKSMTAKEEIEAILIDSTKHISVYEPGMENIIINLNDATDQLLLLLLLERAKGERDGLLKGQKIALEAFERMKAGAEQ